MKFNPRTGPATGRIPARRAAPRCRAGVSSVLRLAHPAATGLPSRVDIGEWAQRAAKALQLPRGPVAMFAPSEFTAG